MKTVIFRTTAILLAISGIFIMANAGSDNFVNENAAALTQSNITGNIVQCFSQALIDLNDDNGKIYTYYDCGRCSKEFGKAEGSGLFCVYTGTDNTDGNNEENDELITNPVINP